MANLENIRKGLYEPDGKRNIPPSFLERGMSASEPDVKKNWGERPQAPAEPPAATPRARKISRFGLLAVAALAVGALAFLGIFYFGFQSEDLKVSAVVKEQMESGERVTYQIFYKNQGSETLHDLELSFTYPPGALPLHEEFNGGSVARTRITLADLPPGKEEKLEIQARIFGQQGEKKTAEAAILYRPEGSTARFVAKANAETTIVRVPLLLTVTMPGDLVSGQTADISIEYASNADAPFEDLSLGVDYPAGFDFVSADPAPSLGNTVWSVGTLKPGDAGTIVVHGKISGTPGEIKTLSTQLGLYNTLTKEWTPYQAITASTRVLIPILSVVGTLDGAREPVVKAGDTIRFKLHYQNTLDIPLKNVSVEVKLDSGLLDLKTLQVFNGAYNGATDSIIWNGASYPTFLSLPAHAEGDLEFLVRVLPLLGEERPAKNLTFAETATIRSLDRPVGLEGTDLSSTDRLLVKIASRAVLSSRALYHNSYLATSGPIPPKVGAKTTYAILWQLGSSVNDLVNAEVHATLSPGAVWENAIVPADSALTYDAGSGAISWRAGTVAAGSSVTQTGPLVAFRVSIVPGPDQIGKSPTLVGSITVTATDSFTNQPVEVKVGDLTTELRSDAATTDTDWRVRP